MHNDSRKIYRRIGNAIMALSIFGLFVIFYPLVRVSLLGTTQAFSSIDTQFKIAIPEIGAAAPILENVDPWDESEYREKLQKGVGHAKGTALPGEEGTVYLFAHSSDYPWRLTRYNTVFLRLGELAAGDEIVISYEGEEFNYEVYDKKTVWPSEVSYLTDTEEDRLILQTCTPLGTDFKRLLVFARPI